MKKKLFAFTLVLALVINIIMPHLTVVAASSYTITFEATEGHVLAIDNGRLKIDGQNVELQNSANEAIGTVSVTGTKATISVSDGTVGKLNYNSDGKFTLYNTAGHVQHNMDTEFSSDTVFMVENFSNGGGSSQNSNVEVVIDNATVAGNVATFNVDNSSVTLTVNGATISNNKFEVDRANLGSVTFSIGGAFDNDTMQIIVRGAENYSSVLTVNNSSTSLNGLNFPNGGLHIAIEPKNNGGSNTTSNANTTANINVTAGSGTYGNNRSYDDDIEFCINGSMWNHGSTLEYNADNSDTTVTFTFGTLWIGRYYDNIVINGTSYTVSDYLDFDNRDEWLMANHGRQVLSFDIPGVTKADNYNIIVKHGDNTGKKYLATFLWTADPSQANSHDYIGNSKLEFVKAVYSVNGTTYTVTEDSLKGKLVRDGNHKTAFSSDGFLSYGITADVNYDDGSLTLPGNAEVTMRVVPEYGYQVTSVNGGKDFKTTEAGVSEFTVTVEEGTAGYFQATVEKVDNTVAPTSEKVKAGEIKLGDSASTDIKNGTVRLSVEDAEPSSDKINNFKEKADEAGNYTISNYLDINLDKVLYKGTAENVWSEQIHRLTDKALITLQLEEGVDASDIVIVHNIDNGDEFEIIQIESYDAETNTITFYTDSFSNYAIAKKGESTENKSSKPTTGDNIIVMISLFVVSICVILITIKVGKKHREKK